MKKFLLFMPLLFLSKYSHAQIFAFSGWEHGYTENQVVCGPTASVGTTTITSSMVHSGNYAGEANPPAGVRGYFGVKSSDPAGRFVTYAVGVPTMYETFWFAYKTLPSSGDEPIAQVSMNTSGTDNKFEVRIDTNTHLVAYDTDLTKLGTGTTALSASTWYRIDIKAGTSSSTSTADAVWEIRINGVSEMSGFNANTSTQPAGMTKLGKVTDRNNNAVDFFYDDAALWSDHYADATQETLMLLPVANGATNQWTIGAGSGANWQQLDEVPNDQDTTYLFDTNSSSDTQVVSFESAGSRGITGTINAVCEVTLCHSTDNINLGWIDHILTSNGVSDTTNPLPCIHVNGETQFYHANGHYVYTDPATSSTWTISGLNGIQAGVIKVHDNFQSNITATYLHVNFTPAVATGLPPERMRMGYGQ